ncbi:Aspartate aminotransferase, cytoplasmic [Nakaseomyces bracarensis]|uniref:Aspartate aminotransferase n=1 Tax=Nakaseomyces bracarensis TaxID=273131 RepID=A0ABR4NST9_9SACH
MSATVYSNIEPIPNDILFATKQRYVKDTNPHKVDLGVGAYRGGDGKPWILPSVRAAEKLVHEDPDYEHEYLNIRGHGPLLAEAPKIMLGDDSDALREDRVLTVQSISGAGALHIAAQFIKKFSPEKKIYISDPTWPIHRQIFMNVGLDVAYYTYWNPATKAIDFEGMKQDIAGAPKGSIFILHACAHNPTGIDPTEAQWEEIIEEIKLGDHIPFFDSAYQGFASGDLAQDAYSIRRSVEKLASSTPIFISQSFSKNVGMYGERVGCLHIVLPRQDADVSAIKESIASQLAFIIRSEVSTPPGYGAKIVGKILNTPELKEKWLKDMVTMSSRIKSMRLALRNFLVEFQTPGNWDHIVDQCGMFSFTGLTPEMTKVLETDYSVYMVPTGRMSVAGLNEGNVEHVARGIHDVICKSLQ